MPKPLIFLTIPGLRDKDLWLMPNLKSLVEKGEWASLAHSFPSVTWPSQSNMLTGKLPNKHGVVANGFFWRDADGDKKNQVEMWTAWNEVIEQPQLWDVLKQNNPSLKTAAWFPMLSKGCGADYVCMPAPIHQPDGSEDLWCYTKPQEFYGELLEKLDHFPLKHFWGPLANIRSSEWIANSAVHAAQKFKPDFFYVYIPHLDYAAQKFGPDSQQANEAVADLDDLIGKLVSQMNSAYGLDVVWLIASEYVITAVDHATYPNRLLRQKGLLQVRIVKGKELIDFEKSAAWALVDHQFSHVFVKNSDPTIVQQVKSIMADESGIQHVLNRSEQVQFGIDHPRSGDVVIISSSNSWQAYYWWLDDMMAPDFARTVDIHRKPGYDPVELCLEMSTMSVPLDATLIKGSHGALPDPNDQQGIVITSADSILNSKRLKDTDLFDRVLTYFGIEKGEI